MAIRSKRKVIWAIGIVAAVLLLAGAALQLAIWRNGPAVLDNVDRLTGGDRGTMQLATKTLGASDARKILVFGPQEVEAKTEQMPVLLFVHGGSWNKGDPADYGFIARAFSPEGFIVVLAGYRLHPEAVYPAMLEDTAAAIAWTHKNIAQFGGDPTRITVSGHSAGAYNVVMAALEKRWLAEHDIDANMLAGVVGLAGPYDFYPFDSDSTRASFGHAEEGETTQPINHVREDAPAKLLIHGEEDTLVRPRNTRELASRLQQVGADVEVLFLPEMDHNRPLLALASPWRRQPEVFKSIVEFARQARASVQVQDEIG